MQRFLLLFAVLLMAGSSARAADRPNILFAFADDWGKYAGIYGKLEPGGLSDAAVTPHFDRIAREGALFTRAFVNAPSCTPCRSSLLSGQHFWRTGRGAILQGAIWDPSIPSYPLILQDAGYHIGHTFKVWSPGTPADAPYGAQATGYNSAGRKFNSFSQQVSNSKNGKYDEIKQRLYEEVRGNFRSFLDKRPKGSPFCYWFGPTNVHRKWTRGSGLKLWGIDPETLQGKVPPFLPDVPAVREDLADYLGEVTAFDAGLGVLLEELERIGELENTLIVVSGDHGAPGFPRGKCNLYDFGIQVPLAVRWPAQVPAGRVLEDFVSLPDLAPTFLQAAGAPVPEVMTGRSILHILRSQAQGQVDPSRDAVVAGRERHVAAARTDNLPYPQRAIRTGDYLLIRNFKPERWPMGTGPGYGEPETPFAEFSVLENNTFAAFADLDASPTKAWLIEHRADPGMDYYFDLAFARRPEFELYDLRQDPHQIRNVAGQAEYRIVQSRLTQRLMEILRETADPRVTEEGRRFENPPFTDAFNNSKSKPKR